jgi:Fe-S-cluster-containing hydrogenase component 2
VEALSRNGHLERVVIDYDLCIGCKLCVAACPFGGVGIDTVARKVIKCELCDGDPTCVAFCQPQALQYLPASTVNLRKKREAGLKFAELMRKFAGI